MPPSILKAGCSCCLGTATTASLMPWCAIIPASPASPCDRPSTHFVPGIMAFGLYNWAHPPPPPLPLHPQCPELPRTQKASHLNYNIRANTTNLTLPNCRIGEQLNKHMFENGNEGLFKRKVSGNSWQNITFCEGKLLSL